MAEATGAPTWIPRLAEAAVEARLRRAGAVLIEGPKASGKTALARRFSQSSVMLDRETAMRRAAAVDPSAVLDGPYPRLLDEYQVVPGLWDAVRGRVDDVGRKGMYLLTGSATPDDTDPTLGRRHTGARRIAPLRLRTLSQYELGASDGAVSLAALLDGRVPQSGAGGIVEPLAALTAACVGGWPDAAGLDVEDAIADNDDYLAVIVETDVQRVDGVARDPNRVAAFLRSWARSVSTTASETTLRQTDTVQLAKETGDAYIDVLRRLGIIDDQPAWSPSLRSRARLRSTPKRHLCDPSLVAAALRVTPDRLLGPEIELAGLLFESFVVHDLRVYADHADASVLFYRDSNDVEADAIVERRDGSWIAVEVKLGARWVDQAAASLLKVRDTVAPRVAERCGALVVVTTNAPTYIRPDGVLVTSIAALGP